MVFTAVKKHYLIRWLQVLIFLTASNSLVCHLYKYNQFKSSFQKESRYSMKRTAGYSDFSARKRVAEGNNLLRQGKITRAVEAYNKVIEEKPYYAVPYYNKRIALSMKEDIPSNSTKHKEMNVDRLIHGIEHINLVTQTNPCFVINTIAAVPERTFSDDSSSSSSDEEDGEFNISYGSVDDPDFPYTTKGKPNSSAWKTEERIIKPPESLLNEIRSKVDVDSVVGPLLSKILKNGFEVDEKDNFSTIAVSVGLNRMYSLSKRKNRSLISVLKSKVDTDKIRCEKFGYFWKCNWYLKDGRAAKIEDVRKFYRQLKRENRNLANKFIAQEENERAERDIPYQYIRDYAKDHPKTRALIKEIISKNSKALIYLHLVDSDVLDFNGVYSAYRRIIQGCYEPPTVMSTGYEFPLEDSGNRAYHLLGLMDKMYRVITTFYIPLGTYYPEPNLCILIPPLCKSVEESFIDFKRGLGSESPILLANIQKNRRDVRAIFSDDNSIITTIPSRAKFDKRTKKTLDFSDEFNQGIVGPSSGDIKKFGKVSQSHTDKFTWLDSLFINKSIECYKKYETDGECITDKNGKPLPIVLQCKNLISNICKNYDVEASRRKLADRIGEDNTNSIVNANKHINRFNVDFNDEYGITPEEQELIDIMKKRGISHDNLTRTSLLTMIQHNVADILKGIDDDHEFHDVFKKIDVILFSKYEEEFSSLSENYGIALDSIISWDYEKIEFLISDDIINVIKILFDDENTFYQIEHSYDNDSDLARDIVNEILSSEEDLTSIDFDFADLEREYVQIVRNMDHYEMQGENVIDIIVRKESYDPEYARIGFALMKQSGEIDSGFSTPRISDSDEDRTSLFEGISNDDNDGSDSDEDI